MPDYNDLAYSLAGVKRKNPFDERRSFANKMLAQGADASPVLHPLQGAARLAQALVGGWMGGQADRDEATATAAHETKIKEASSIADPAERMAALSALGGDAGLRATIASTGQELAKKRQRDDDMQASSFLLGGGGSGPQQAGGAANAIAGIESGGRYDAIGPDTGGGNRAHGKYQVMASNVGPWTKEILGKAMTPQEFLANPQAQDAVFQGKFGQYRQQYGSDEAAARAWFAGPGGMNNPNAADVNGMTVARYGQKFQAGMQGQGGPQQAVLRGPPGTPTPIGTYTPGTARAELAQGSADGSGTPLPTQSYDAGGQYEEAARRAHAAGRGDIAIKYMQQATAAREAAAKSADSRNLQTVDLGDSVGILDPRTGNVVQRIPKGQKPGAGGEPGAFGGTGMENQARSALVRAAQDPAFAASPIYAAAHSYLSKPRFDAQSGTTIPPEDLTRFPAPTYNAQGQSQAQPPQQATAAPPTGAPPAPSPSVVSGPAVVAQPPGGGIVATPVQGLPPREKPMTEAEAKAYSFYGPMATANALLTDLAIQGTSKSGRFAESLPGGVGAFMQSPEYQRFEQAKRSFLNAKLRDESGAVIGPSEFMSADKQYFPQPGQETNKALLDQMAENRRQVVEAMMVKAKMLKPGQRYEPPKAEGGQGGAVDLKKKWNLE